MRKRPFNRSPDQRQRYREYLNTVTDTQPTLTSARTDDIGDLSYEDAPPPFKENDGSSNFITFRDFKLTFKTICVVCSIFLIVVIPLVWFFSNLNHHVQTLRLDVDNLRNKFDTMWGDSIRQRARIDAIEKFSSDIKSGDSAPSSMQKK